MPEPLHFVVSLNVFIDRTDVDAVLKAAEESGVDYGDNLLTLHKAAVVLANTGDFTHFSGWSAGPLWDEDTLRSLLIAKLAENDLTPADFPNWFLHEDDDQPNRFVAVEKSQQGREGKAEYWLYTGTTPEELADTMDMSEASHEHLVFVTDLVTGLDLEANTKLTYF